MSELDWPEPQEPTPRAVRFGRIVLCSVGAALLGVGGWFSYHNPQEQVLFAACVLSAGLIFIWLGLALPPKVVAHFGFWLPWFTE